MYSGVESEILHIKGSRNMQVRLHGEYKLPVVWISVLFFCLYMSAL